MKRGRDDASGKFSMDDLIGAARAYRASHSFAGWPPRVCIFGWAAKPKRRQAYYVQGNHLESPVEFLMLPGSGSAIFHNLAQTLQNDGQTLVCCI